MTTCIELLRTFAASASEAVRFTQSEAVASACVQAEGAIRAGIVQAKAARDAGHMAAFAGGLVFLAGILAALAALYAGRSALRGVRLQISADLQKQKEDREFIVKRDVYFSATSALFSGVLAVARVSDLRVSLEDAMSDYLGKLPALAHVHMVANVETVKAVLDGVNSISAAHQGLCRDRIKLDLSDSPNFLNRQIRWSEHCLSQLPILIQPLTGAVVAMREELGMSIDADIYESVIQDVSQQANAQAAGFFGHLLNMKDIAQPTA